MLGRPGVVLSSAPAPAGPPPPTPPGGNGRYWGAGPPARASPARRPASPRRAAGPTHEPGSGRAKGPRPAREVPAHPYAQFTPSQLVETMKYGKDRLLGHPPAGWRRAAPGYRHECRPAPPPPARERAE